MKEETYGETSDKLHDDWDGVGELISMPDSAAHRHVDKVVLAASHAHPDKIKTAIVCPPTIYGKTIQSLLLLTVWMSGLIRCLFKD